MPKFSIFNFLLVLALISTAFAWHFERSGMQLEVEQEIEDIHFGWGALRTADARIRMAEMTLANDDELSKDHKLELFDSLNNLIRQKDRIDNYAGMREPQRAIKYASRVLDLLEVSVVEDFATRVVEVYGDEKAFHWDKEQQKMSPASLEFLILALKFEEDQFGSR